MDKLSNALDLIDQIEKQVSGDLCPDCREVRHLINRFKEENRNILDERNELEKENQLLHERILSNDETYKELTECCRLSIVKDDEIMRLAEVIKTYIEQLASAQKAVEDLRCCGNCSKNCDSILFGGLSCRIFKKSVAHDECCKDWQPDGLTRKEREK